MTLLTKHIEAGWHEVTGYATTGVRAAERFLNIPGQTASLIRVEGKNQAELHAAIDQREAALGGDVSASQKVVIYPGGVTLTDAQHNANVELDVQPKPGQDPVPGGAGAPAPDVQLAEAALTPAEQEYVAARDAGTLETVQPSESEQAEIDKLQAEVDALNARLAQDETTTTKTETEPDKVEAPLTDEERAALAANEAALEAGAAAQAAQ